MQQEIEVQERQHENIELFIQKADKYVGIEKLTPYALRELIQGIYVEAPDKSSGKRRQTTHIKYDGIGFIPLDVLMNGKTAWPKSRRFPRTPSSHDILNFTVLRPPCIFRAAFFAHFYRQMGDRAQGRQSGAQRLAAGV